MWCWSSVCPHKAIVYLLQPTQCGVGPECVPIKLLSTYFNPVWCWSRVCPHKAIVYLLQPTQCGVGPVCVPIKLLSTYFNPVWCWSRVCPHKAIVYLLQPTQCGVGQVCVPIKLLSTYFNPVWCWSRVCPHKASFHTSPFICIYILLLCLHLISQCVVSSHMLTQEFSKLAVKRMFVSPTGELCTFDEEDHHDEGRY